MGMCLVDEAVVGLAWLSGLMIILCTACFVADFVWYGFEFFKRRFFARQSEEGQRWKNGNGGLGTI